MMAFSILITLQVSISLAPGLGSDEEMALTCSHSIAAAMELSNRQEDIRNDMPMGIGINGIATVTGHAEERHTGLSMKNSSTALTTICDLNMIDAVVVEADHTDYIGESIIDFRQPPTIITPPQTLHCSMKKSVSYSATAAKISSGQESQCTRNVSKRPTLAALSRGQSVLTFQSHHSMEEGPSTPRVIGAQQEYASSNYRCWLHKKCGIKMFTKSEKVCKYTCICVHVFIFIYNHASANLLFA